MTQANIRVIILAAGKGTRMRSNLPKVLHQVAGKPMVAHVIETAQAIGAQGIELIFGHGADQLKAQLAHYPLNWVEQTEQLGTGHAVQQALPAIQDNETVVILYGDVPLIQAETLNSLMGAKGDAALALLTVQLPDPTGYGRIIRTAEGKITGIVEQKDASSAELAITEVNSGIMAASGKALKNWLQKIDNNNAQGEYYLTDIVAFAAQEGVVIQSAQPPHFSEVEGANNRVQLAALERAYQLRAAEQLMLAGATLVDPARIDIRGEVQVGEDVFIDANVIFEGKVSLGNGVRIESHCVIKDSQIAEDAHIKSHSVLEKAVVGKQASVGPFARLRPGAELKQGAAVGNFVEIKAAILGEGAKAGHLSYLGDAEIGAHANIGAGTITCNYDGVHKHKTRIGDHAFIGSNASLVAPLNIGQGATTGAGSTINKDVPADALAVGRAKQRVIEGWQRPVKD